MDKEKAREETIEKEEVVDGTDLSGIRAATVEENTVRGWVDEISIEPQPKVQINLSNGETKELIMDVDAFVSFLDDAGIPPKKAPQVEDLEVHYKYDTGELETVSSPTFNNMKSEFEGYLPLDISDKYGPFIPGKISSVETTNGAARIDIDVPFENEQTFFLNIPKTWDGRLANLCDISGVVDIEDLEGKEMVVGNKNLLSDCSSFEPVLSSSGEFAMAPPEEVEVDQSINPKQLAKEFAISMGTLQLANFILCLFLVFNSGNPILWIILAFANFVFMSLSYRDTYRSVKESVRLQEN